MSDELVRQAPFAVAMLLLSLAFIRYLKYRDKILKEISGSCHATQDRATAAQDRATEAIIDYSRMSGETHAVLVQVRNLLIRMNGRNV